MEEVSGASVPDRAGGLRPEPAAQSQPAGAHPLRIAFNVNETVWIKLTDEGRKLLAKKERHLNLLHGRAGRGGWFPQPDADGWAKWQLWALMSEFGDDCFIGARVPFETTILLDAKALKASEPA